MTAQKGSSQRFAGMVAILLTALCPLSAVPAAEVLDLPNGIRATVYDADEIASGLVIDKSGTAQLIHPAVGSLTLGTGEDLWFPMDRQAVIAALRDMHDFSADVDVDVFILPAPPLEVTGSFSSRGAIFLAPGSGPVDESTVAYITTHEMGHVLTWAFLDDHPGRWEAYLALRGLTEANLDPEARHADRAREILAEDIRFLFGSALATASGSIENHTLATPDRVEGLADLLRAFFADRDPGPLAAVSSAFPNPCNPLTTIRMILPAGTSAPAGGVLRIYDVRGSLVRTLRGGREANGALALQWNGGDESGRTVASGRYLYRIEAAGAAARGTITLVR